MDDSDEPLDLSVGELDLASFKRIQAQVFDLNCLSCHGGGSGLAGQLDLRDDVAYKSLVNVKAPLSEEGKNYVTPGNINNSFLLDILENNPVHKDMFNSSGKQEVLALIQGWILGGALDIDKKEMMNYTRRIDTDKAVEMQISSFTGKGGTTEYQVMVSITDPCLSFVEQLQNLLRVYVTVVKEELSNDATAVFRRYFLK